MTPAEQKLARQLYGVFELLRDSEDFIDSGTAEKLRNRGTGFFKNRVKEEWAELHGVIAGTHKHTGFASDFLLESSQIFYWLALSAVKESKTFDDFLADKSYNSELKKLLTLHTKHQIPFLEVLQKDLADCRKKGYL